MTTYGPRIVTVNIRSKGCTAQNLKIISAYAPTESDTEINRYTFWENLEKILTDTPKRTIPIVLTDANGMTGYSEAYDKVIGNFYNEDTNRNGIKLLEVCKELNLCLVNTFFQHKTGLEYTYKGVGDNEKAPKCRLDYVITRQEHMKHVIGCKITHGINLAPTNGTDRASYHKPVTIEFKYKYTQQKKNTSKHRWDRKTINTVEFKKKLKDKLKNKNFEINGDINLAYENILNEIITQAKTIAPSAKPKKKECLGLRQDF